MSTVVTAKKTSHKTERRVAKRYGVYTRYPVLVYTDAMRKNGETPATGLLTDVGLDGLGIIINTRISSNADVLVLLHPETTQEHQIQGRSIWVNTMPTTNHVIKSGTDGPTSFWRLGLRLNAEDKEQTEFIQKLLTSLRK